MNYVCIMEDGYNNRNVIYHSLRSDRELIKGDYIVRYTDGDLIEQSSKVVR